jgi:hypothetical protein
MPPKKTGDKTTARKTVGGKTPRHAMKAQSYAPDDSDADDVEEGRAKWNSFSVGKAFWWFNSDI